MKAIKILSVLFVLFALLTSAVNVRAEKTTFQITEVKVEGTSVFGNSGTLELNVERGDSIAIEVWVEGGDSGTGIVSDDNVRIKAEINGYEYGDIEAKTDTFSVKPGVTYKKTLRLNIPNDLDLESNLYTLNVEASSNDFSDETNNDIQLNINSKRHYLNIQDVIISPSTSVEAGKNIFAKVRLENLGDKKEQDIKVEMSIPELGLSTRTYIDELVPKELDTNNDEETSMSSPEMYLKLPEDANGKYTLKFTVTYNRGHTTEEQTFDLLVKGQSRPTVPSSTVSIDTTSQTIQAGKGAVYKLMFSNLGQQPVTYSVDIAGVSGWGTTRVDPDTVTVMPDTTADMFVFVAASENTKSGVQPFTLNIKQDGQVVKQLGLTANVQGASASSDDSFKNIRQGLEVGFIVLLIILVILGLILAARKLGGGSKESMEEPSSKTYY